MRKIATLLVVGLLLMTALMAFAGGSDENFVHTLPEEFVEPSEQVPSVSVTPCIDCNHTCGTCTLNRKEYTDCCEYVTYEEVYCLDCGTYLGTQNEEYGSDNHHIGQWEEGSAFLNDAGRWIVEYHCSHCNEYGGWRYL